jgi:O-phosphoseryl-tRNA(Cys) synthetase
MKCLCDNWLEISTFGVYKCPICKRVYTYNENGFSYAGKNKYGIFKD